MESHKTCLLKDETEADKRQLALFVNYYLKVPGYNGGDLTGQDLDLPESCQEYLRSLGGTSLEEMISISAHSNLVFQAFSPSEVPASMDERAQVWLQQLWPEP